MALINNYTMSIVLFLKTHKGLEILCEQEEVEPDRFLNEITRNEKFSSQ